MTEVQLVIDEVDGPDSLNVEPRHNRRAASPSLFYSASCYGNAGSIPVEAMRVLQIDLASITTQKNMDRR